MDKSLNVWWTLRKIMFFNDIFVVFSLSFPARCIKGKHRFFHPVLCFSHFLQSSSSFVISTLFTVFIGLDLRRIFFTLLRVRFHCRNGLFFIP